MSKRCQIILVKNWFLTMWISGLFRRSIWAIILKMDGSPSSPRLIWWQIQIQAMSFWNSRMKTIPMSKPIRNWRMLLFWICMTRLSISMAITIEYWAFPVLMENLCMSRERLRILWTTFVSFSRYRFALRKNSWNVQSCIVLRENRMANR